MLEVTKETCIAYLERRFFEGACEFCVNAYECEQLRFSIRESKRTPQNDWLDVKGLEQGKDVVL